MQRQVIVHTILPTMPFKLKLVYIIPIIIVFADIRRYEYHGTAAPRLGINIC